MRPTRDIWFYIKLAFTLIPRIAWSLWRSERPWSDPRSRLKLVKAKWLPWSIRFWVRDAQLRWWLWRHRV